MIGGDQSADDIPMEELINADEIDDPFSTPYDKQIEAKDICERLQVRLKDRMNPSAEEINTEAEWVFDKLMQYASLKIDPEGNYMGPEFKYDMLLRKKDAKAKIIKVLTMLRKDLLDVPMIAAQRMFEYKDELDEDSIWII